LSFSDGSAVEGEKK